MSTLRVNTLQDVAGTGQPSMSGAAKAWVNFNGTGTVAIRSSFNVTSITDNGVGDYTINFTTAMADTEYALVGAGGATALAYAEIHVSSLTAPTASAVRIHTVSQNSGNPTYTDHTRICAAIFD